MNSASADRLTQALLDAIAERADPDYALEALRAFLARYGEARTERVYGGPPEAADAARLPPRIYYPLDSSGAPIEVGRRYRTEDGSTLAVDYITLGRDADHTTIHFTDGSYEPAGRVAPARPRAPRREEGL